MDGGFITPEGNTQMSRTEIALQTEGTESDDPRDRFREYLVRQEYSAYSESAHTVWREVLARNERMVAEYESWMHPAYVEGLKALSLPGRIPRIEEINERLAPTGWTTVSVDGYIPTSAYVGLMSERLFPVARKIRRFEHIDFAPAPDMVHDILGHLPMLFSSEHRDYLKDLAAVMARATANELDYEFYEANVGLAELKCDPNSCAVILSEAESRVQRVNRAVANNASELTHMRRMYIWSIEFGLIGEPNAFLVYGAGLLSAPSEVRTICDGASCRVPYSLEVVNYEHAFSDLQPQYFVARDFSHLREVLTDYEQGMRNRVPEARASEIREIAPTNRRQRSDNA